MLNLNSDSNFVYSPISSPTVRSLKSVNSPWSSESILMLLYVIWYSLFGFYASQWTVFQGHESMATSSLVVYRL